jgi:rubrerythrin
MSHEQISKSIRCYNDAFLYSIRSGAPTVEQPTDIKTPLRNHQKAILYEMEMREQQLSKGMDLSGAKVFSRFSFLGDGVGVGKSLMVLGHIARLKYLPAIPTMSVLDTNATSQMYSLHDFHYTNNPRDIGCLIVVPHTLYRQWQAYIKEQTTLKYLGIQTKKTLDSDSIRNKLLEADVVLVSNTLYGGLQEIARTNNFLWKRVFYDEADTLHIPSTRIQPQTRFSWLISASWANLLFPNQSLYITVNMINEITNSPAHNIQPELRDILRGALQNSTHGMYTYIRHMMMSPSFFREFVHTNNPARGRLVLRCHDAFVKESITLPPITIQNIVCKPSLIQQVVQHAIPGNVRSLLHAGDVQGALTELGVRTEEPMSLVQAVSENRLKELDRLKKTYDFKSSLEYATPQAKENALKSLKERMNSLEEQIKQLKERVENYKNEMCPICFDEPQKPTLTPCCSRIFCAGCILTSLTRQTTCPLCRAQITASGLRSLATEPIAKNEIINADEGPQPLKKTEQLLEILKQKPDGKFLVFSRYDNPFLQLTTEIEGLNITVKQVKGNKDVIASTLKSFEAGKTKVLLLNSIEAGAGMNITSASDVILLHAMTHEEEKQILGRAYRLGRTEPLSVKRLLHPEELQHTHSTA